MTVLISICFLKSSRWLEIVIFKLKINYLCLKDRKPSLQQKYEVNSVMYSISELIHPLILVSTQHLNHAEILQQKTGMLLLLCFHWNQWRSCGETLQDSFCFGPLIKSSHIGLHLRSTVSVCLKQLSNKRTVLTVFW